MSLTKAKNVCIFNYKKINVKNMNITANTLYNLDILELCKDIPDEYFDCVVTDCPYKIIAGGVRVVEEGDETCGILGKRDYSKTDPKGCLNRGRRVVSDGSVIGNKWVPKNPNHMASAVKDGKMFSHNEIKFSEWLPEMYRVLKKGTHCYIMVNGRNLTELTIEAEKVGFIWQQLLIWDKKNVTPNKYYMNGVEFILMLSKRPAKNINNMGSKNIISIPNFTNKGGKMHPTAKPVDLMKYLINNSTNEGDLVFEPFAGGGSTLIACKELNRNFIGCEIDPEYFDMALKNLDIPNDKII